MKIAVFKKGIENIMKANQDSKERLREKSGIIDSKRLVKIETTPRVFKKRRLEKKGKDYFISFLIDASGSMSHTNSLGRSRAEIALESIKKISESFEGIVGLHYEIVIFSNEEILAKGYDEKYDDQKIKSLYDIMMGNTPTNGVVGDIKDTSTGKVKKFFRIIDDSTMNENMKYKDDNAGFFSLHDLVWKSEDILKRESSTILEKLKINIGHRDELINFKSTGLGGTSYSQAILNSKFRMIQRTGRKMLLMLTDGDEYIHEALRDSNRQKKITTSSSFYIPKKFVNYKTFSQRLRRIKKATERFVYTEWFRNQILKPLESSRDEEIKVVCLGINTHKSKIAHFNHYEILQNEEKLLQTMIKILKKVFKKD